MYWKSEKYKINYTKNAFKNHSNGIVFSMIIALAKLRAQANRMRFSISSIFSTR